MHPSTENDAMKNFRNLTTKLQAAESLCSDLAAGRTTSKVDRDSLVELLDAVTMVALFIEEEVLGGKRIGGATIAKLRDAVDGWIESSELVAARRGE